jgi:uncharacterized membrane protein
MKFSLTDIREVKKFFIIFYSVGIVGMTIPALLPYFQMLIPYALILNVGYVFYFHQHKAHLRSWFVFALIFILGMAIEIIGVKTGIIFGEYSYVNSSLGWQWYSVPILIGVNWVFLVYASAALFESFRMSKVIKIIAGSSVMVLYDFIMEFAAPIMNMWKFAKSPVPIENYIIWFISAIVFHSFIQYGNIKIHNQLVKTVLFCQFFFFTAIVLIYRFIW